MYKTGEKVLFSEKGEKEEIVWFLVDTLDWINLCQASVPTIFWAAVCIIKKYRRKTNDSCRSWQNKPRKVDTFMYDVQPSQARLKANRPVSEDWDDGDGRAGCIKCPGKASFTELKEVLLAAAVLWRHRRQKEHKQNHVETVFWNTRVSIGELPITHH